MEERKKWSLLDIFLYGGVEMCYLSLFSCWHHLQLANRTCTKFCSVHPIISSSLLFFKILSCPSRAHSPGMAAPSFSGAARFNTSLHSPSPRGHHGMLSSPNSTVNETVLVPEMEPIVPDLCMEQLWSESVTAGCQRYLPALNLTENRHRDWTFSSIKWIELFLN